MRPGPGKDNFDFPAEIWPLTGSGGSKDGRLNGYKTPLSTTPHPREVKGRAHQVSA